VASYSTPSSNVRCSFPEQVLSIQLERLASTRQSLVPQHRLCEKLTTTGNIYAASIKQEAQCQGNLLKELLKNQEELIKNQAEFLKYQSEFLKNEAESLKRQDQLSKQISKSNAVCAFAPRVSSFFK
jgi:hypothetical protein